MSRAQVTHKSCTSHAHVTHESPTSHPRVMHESRTSHARVMHESCTSQAQVTHKSRTSHARVTHESRKSQSQVGGGGGGDKSISEHPPVFRAPRAGDVHAASVQGRVMLHTSSRTPKNCMGKGHTNKQTDKRTSRLLERIGLRADALKTKTLLQKF